MKRIMHPVEVLPEWATLDSSIQRHFESASRCLMNMPPIDSEGWRETACRVPHERHLFLPAFEDERRKLEDEVLPLYIEHRGEPKDFTSRTSLEENALTTFFGALSGAVASGSFEDFQGALQAAATSMNPESGIFRDGPVFLNADQNGDYWEFPAPDAISPAMRRIFALLQSDGDPTYIGALCYLLLVHAHPFRDGNGRTSRLLCNFAWRLRTGNAHYVPLKEVFALGRGSFGISLTRVRSYGEWMEFLQFFHVGVRLVHAFPAGQAYRSCAA